MLYKVELKQKSVYLGNIQANTLFGAFLTAYSSFTELDDDMINDIVLSDLFVKGRYPVGIDNNAVIYSKGDVKSNTVTVNRTMLSRKGDGQNNILNETGHFSGEMEFFIYSDLLDEELLEKIIKQMLVLGIGKWRNVGKGQFELVSISEYIPDMSAKTYVAMSNFKPSDDELQYVKDTGYEVRNAYATNGKKQQNICLLKAGTTLNAARQFIGKHIYDENSGTYIHAKSIIMWI